MKKEEQKAERYENEMYQDANKSTTDNGYGSSLYTVRVICWDGVEYTREATKEEIDAQRKRGYVKEDGYSGITFDFRVSHGV